MHLWEFLGKCRNEGSAIVDGFCGHRLFHKRTSPDFFLQDSTPKLMVTCDEEKDKVFKDRIANVQNERTLSKESKSAAVVMDIENVESNDVACVCYTSGTTG